MPVFPFSKERFDPHTPLAYGFLVRLGRLISTDPIQILLIHTAAEAAPLFAGGTLGFEWAVVAVFSPGSIAARLLSRMGSIKAQFFACWTEVDVTLCLIANAV